MIARPGSAGRRRATLLALLVVFALGCETVAPRLSGDRRAYQEAIRLEASDRKAAEVQLRKFLRERPGSSYADDAALRLMDLLEADGRGDEAAKVGSTALRMHPTGDQSDRIRIRLAQYHQENGDASAGYRALRGIRLSLLEREERATAHRLLADLAGATSRPAEQVRWLGRVHADARSEEGKAEVDREIDAVLRELDAGQLERVAAALGRRIPAARVRLRQAELALQRGDEAEAALHLAQAEGLPLTPGGAQRLALVEERLGSGLPLDGSLGEDGFAEDLMPDPSRVRGTLGVVLPLSGRLARVGARALDGIVLASGVFEGQERGGEGLRLLVRDSKGTADGAREAVESLAASGEVLAILGPLTAPATEAAGEVAERARIPMLALTRHEDIAPRYEHVLRVGLTSRAEVERVVDVARRELGIARVAILYPKDDYGRRMRALFFEAAEARGLEMAGIASYEDGATDFSEPIRRLIGFHFLTNDESYLLARRKGKLDKAKRLPPASARALREEAAGLRAPDGSPLPPYVDFDAIFVPDGSRVVGLIAPALAFHDVQVRMLGTASWNDPELLRLGGEHVEGAVFPGSVYENATFPNVAEFERRFRIAYERPPDALAARAFDATQLVVQQLVRGRDQRNTLLAGLLSGIDSRGVSGEIRFSPDGNAESRPHLLGIEDGQVVCVDELGRAPYLPGEPGDEVGAAAAP